MRAVIWVKTGEQNEMHKDKGNDLAKESLLCFAMAILLSIPAGGYGEWWNGPLQLVLGWKWIAGASPERAFWLVPRMLYCLAAWMGLRSFLQSRAPYGRSAAAAGGLSLLALGAGIAASLLLPEISRQQ